MLFSDPGIKSAVQGKAGNMMFGKLTADKGTSFSGIDKKQGLFRFFQQLPQNIQFLLLGNNNCSDRGILHEQF